VPDFLRAGSSLDGPADMAVHRPFGFLGRRRGQLNQLDLLLLDRSGLPDGFSQGFKVVHYLAELLAKLLIMFGDSGHRTSWPSLRDRHSLCFPARPRWPDRLGQGCELTSDRRLIRKNGISIYSNTPVFLQPRLPGKPKH